MAYMGSDLFNYKFFADVECPIPNVGSTAELVGNNFTYGATVRYRCKEGYYVARNVTFVDLKCTKSGRWNLDLRMIQCLRKLYLTYQEVIRLATFVIFSQLCTHSLAIHQTTCLRPPITYLKHLSIPLSLM